MYEARGREETYLVSFCLKPDPPSVRSLGAWIIVDYSDRRVIVTGGTGVLGSAVVAPLDKRSCDAVELVVVPWVCHERGLNHRTITQLLTK